MNEIRRQAFYLILGKIGVAIFTKIKYFKIVKKEKNLIAQVRSFWVSIFGINFISTNQMSPFKRTLLGMQWF